MNVSGITPEMEQRLQRQLEAAEQSERNLKSGDGDGTSGGMEARIARLESDMEHVKKGVDKLDAGQSDIKKTLVGVEKVLATLEERTKHMPTKWEVFAIVTAIVLFFSALVGLALRFVPPAQ